MIRFWLNDREYTAPESWMRDAIRARRVLGMTANEAAVDAMAAWARRQRTGMAWPKTCSPSSAS